MFIGHGAAIEQLPTESGLQPPIWIIGSGLTVRAKVGDAPFAGVPGTNELSQFLAQQWRAGLKPGTAPPPQLTDLESRIKAATEPDVIVKLYQSACAELMKREKLRPAIRRAVLKATDDYESVLKSVRLDNDDELEASVGVIGRVPGPGFTVANRRAQWSVRPGIRSLVKWIHAHPVRSGHAIITTNFDPLLSVAFNEENVAHVRFSIDSDHSMKHVSASIPVVYHVHGYWAQGEMLNLSEEIAADKRQQLNSSLVSLLSGRVVYVLGYSGWDDVVMNALQTALGGRALVYWCCHTRDDQFQEDAKRIKSRLKASDASLKFVEAVDADAFLTEALAQLGYQPKPKQADLEATLVRLERQITEKVQNIELLTRMESMVGKALESMEDFNRKTKDFKDDFDTHRANQATKLDRILNELVGLVEKTGELIRLGASTAQATKEFKDASAQLIYIDEVVTYLGEWLSRVSYNMIGGMKPHPPAVPERLGRVISKMKDAGPV